MIPTLIVAFSCSLANLLRTLIGSSKVSPNTIALGPSNNASSIPIDKSFKARLTNVFL